MLWISLLPFDFHPNFYYFNSFLHQNKNTRLVSHIFDKKTNFRRRSTFQKGNTITFGTAFQQRLLARRPEIVVGTPGRLWDLISEGDSHLAMGVKDINYLAIDETDRMVEKGHFEELQQVWSLTQFYSLLTFHYQGSV